MGWTVGLWFSPHQLPWLLTFWARTSPSRLWRADLSAALRGEVWEWMGGVTYRYAQIETNNIDFSMQYIGYIGI